MHVFPATIIGVAVWLGIMADESNRVMGFICGPLIVSGVVFLAALLPTRRT